MKNYAHQVAAFAIAILIGGVVGATIMGKNKNKEILELVEKHKKELQKDIKEKEKLIKKRDEKIENLLTKAQQDSLLINSLQKKIVADGVIVEKRRREALKLTDDEKRNWLINRYSVKP